MKKANEKIAIAKRFLEHIDAHQLRNEINNDGNIRYRIKDRRDGFLCTKIPSYQSICASDLYSVDVAGRIIEFLEKHAEPGKTKTKGKG